MRLRRNLIWWLKLGMGVFMLLAGIYIITHHTHPDGHPTKHSEERALPLQEHIPAPYLDDNKNNVLQKQIAGITLKTLGIY